MEKEMKAFHYRIILTDISEGKEEAFEAYVPAFQAYHFGNTPQEALEAYQVYFQDEKKRRAKKGLSMPAPDVELKQKQVPVRMSVELYENIASLARQKRTSFNRFVVETLEHVGEK